MVAKIRARFEGNSINPEQKFGFVTSVFYDLKIKQVEGTLLVKHLEDNSKDNIKKYANFIDFLNDWHVRVMYSK